MNKYPRYFVVDSNFFSIIRVNSSKTDDYQWHRKNHETIDKDSNDIDRFGWKKGGGFTESYIVDNYGEVSAKQAKNLSGAKDIVTKPVKYPRYFRNTGFSTLAVMQFINENTYQWLTTCGKVEPSCGYSLDHVIKNYKEISAAEASKISGVIVPGFVVKKKYPRFFDVTKDGRPYYDVLRVNSEKVDDYDWHTTDKGDNHWVPGGGKSLTKIESLYPEMSPTKAKEILNPKPIVVPKENPYPHYYDSRCLGSSNAVVRFNSELADDYHWWHNDSSEWCKGGGHLESSFPPSSYPRLTAVEAFDLCKNHFNFISGKVKPKISVASRIVSMISNGITLTDSVGNSVILTKNDFETIKKFANWS